MLQLLQCKNAQQERNHFRKNAMQKGLYRYEYKYQVLVEKSDKRRYKYLYCKSWFLAGRRYEYY